MLLKCCTQYAGKLGKLSSVTGLEKVFSFQTQRKAMPENVQTTAQLHSSQFSSVQSLSRGQLFVNCSMPGLPVHHQLPEFTQTHVYQVGDAIQPSHPLSSPSPLVPNPSQHQGLFQWINSAWGGQNIGVSASTSVLPMNTQDWSPFKWPDWISLQSKGLSRVFSNITIQKHQFIWTRFRLGPTLTSTHHHWKNHSLD